MINKPQDTLYIGMTSNLLKWVWEHKEGVFKGFTSRYNLQQLVYYEAHENVESAFIREKRLKAWKRQWKVDLLDEHNPQWCDLYDEVAAWVL